MAIKNPSAIGQAINLAAADARQIGKESDVNYIFKRFIFWEHFCEVIQNGDKEMIQEVIDSPTFDAAMSAMRKAFGESK